MICGELPFVSRNRRFYYAVGLGFRPMERRLNSRTPNVEDELGQL